MGDGLVVGDEMSWGRFLACWRRRDGEGFGWLGGGVVGMKSGEGLRCYVSFSRA
jgi:hypothetical protein